MRGPWPGQATLGASADEALVVAHHELGFDLLHRLDDDGHDDQEAGATEPDRPEIAEQDADEGGQDRDDAEEQRAGERDPGDDPGQVFLRGPSGPDARDEAAVLAQLLGGLVGLERERGVEVREADVSRKYRTTYSSDRGLKQRDDPVRDVAARSGPPRP